MVNSLCYVVDLGCKWFSLQCAKEEEILMACFGVVLSLLQSGIFLSLLGSNCLLHIKQGLLCIEFQKWLMCQHQDIKRVWFLYPLFSDCSSISILLLSPSSVAIIDMPGGHAMAWHVFPDFPGSVQTRGGKLSHCLGSWLGIHRGQIFLLGCF